MNRKKHNLEQLNDRLKFQRLRIGYSQQNIADLLGINRSTYTYYESGKTKPDIETLRILARLYDITIDELICGDNQIPTTFSQRPKKRVTETIEEITGLTNEERSVIAVLRVKEKGYIPRLLDALQKAE